MPGKPLLFISHSTSGLPADARAKLILEALYEALHSDWDVFLDNMCISGGDSWRPTILNALARAQAGIILIDDKATKSTWVKAETSILCFHRAINSKFSLIPLRIETLDAADEWFDAFEPFQLREIQFNQAQEGQGELAANVVAARIAEKLRETGIPIVGQYNRWVREVAAILQDLSASALHRALALQAAMPEPVRLTITNEQEELLQRAVAQLLHHQPVADPVLALVQELATELERVKLDSLCRKIKVKWVSNEAATIMLVASQYPEKYGVLMLRAIKQEIATEHLNRVRVEAPEPRFVNALWAGPALGDSVEAKVASIYKAIKAEFLSSDEDEISEQDLVAAVAKELADERYMSFCAVPQECADATVLEKVRAQFPRITFLVWGKSPEQLLGVRWCNLPSNPPGTLEYNQLTRQLNNLLQSKN